MGEAIKVQLTGQHQWLDLWQIGLEVPCMLILEHLGQLYRWSSPNWWQQCIHRSKTFGNGNLWLISGYKARYNSIS